MESAVRCLGTREEGFAENSLTKAHRAARVWTGHFHVLVLGLRPGLPGPFLYV